MFDICRLCLWKTTNVRNLCSGVPENQSFARKIKETVGIVIERNDGLSSIVCTYCAYKVELFYEFKIICKGSDEFQKEHAQMFYEYADSELSEQEQRNNEEDITIKEEPIFDDGVALSDEILSTDQDSLRNVKSASSLPKQEQLGESVSTYNSAPGSILKVEESRFIMSEDTESASEPDDNSFHFVSRNVSAVGILTENSQEEHVLDQADIPVNTLSYMKKHQSSGRQSSTNVRTANADKQYSQHDQQKEITETTIKLEQNSVSANTGTDTESVEIDVSSVKELETGPRKTLGMEVKTPLTSDDDISTMKKQKMARSKRKYRKKYDRHIREVRRKQFTCIYQCRYCSREFRYRTSCTSHEYYCYEGLESFEDTVRSNVSNRISRHNMRRFSLLPSLQNKISSTLNTVVPVNSDKQRVCYSGKTAEKLKETKSTVTELPTRGIGVQEHESFTEVHNSDMSCAVEIVDCEKSILLSDTEAAENEKGKPEYHDCKDNKTKVNCPLSFKAFKEELTHTAHANLCGMRNKVKGTVRLKCNNCRRNFRYLSSLRYHEALCTVYVKTRGANQCHKLKKYEKITVNNLSLESNAMAQIYKTPTCSQELLPKGRIKKSIHNRIAKLSDNVNKCQYCLKVFKSNFDRYRHQRMCTDLKSTSSDTSDKQISSKIYSNGSQGVGASRTGVITRNFKKSLKCTYCKQKFRSRKHFTTHKRNCQLVKITQSNLASTNPIDVKDVTGIRSFQKNQEQVLPTEVHPEMSNTAAYTRFKMAAIICDESPTLYSHEQNGSKTKPVHEFIIPSQSQENLSRSLEVSEYCQPTNDSLLDSYCETTDQFSSHNIQNCSLKMQNVSVTKNNFQCYYCDCIFKFKDTLTAHIKVCALVKNHFVCNKCKQKFCSKILLKLHTFEVCNPAHPKNDHSYAANSTETLDEDKLMRNAVVRLTRTLVCDSCNCTFSD